MCLSKSREALFIKVVIGKVLLKILRYTTGTERCRALTVLPVRDFFFFYKWYYTECIYACNLLLSLNIIAKLGKEVQSTRPPSLWTPIVCSGVPRATLTFHNLLKHSLNTLRAAILTFITYHRERIQIKISQGEKHIR